MGTHCHYYYHRHRLPLSLSLLIQDSVQGSPKSIHILFRFNCIVYSNRMPAARTLAKLLLFVDTTRKKNSSMSLSLCCCFEYYLHRHYKYCGLTTFTNTVYPSSSLRPSLPYILMSRSTPLILRPSRPISHSKLVERKTENDAKRKQRLLFNNRLFRFYNFIASVS